MNVSEDTVLRLVGMVYDAALDERKWPLFLEAFAHAVGGASSILRSADCEAGAADFVASVGYDPAWKEAYCNHFVKVDLFNRIMNQDTPGKIFLSNLHFDQPELRKSEYYNDYLLPQDKVHLMGAILANDGRQSLVLGTQRGKRAGVFGEEEIRLMGILAPHVARAVQVHRKLNAATAEKELLLGALDHLRMGVILTNNLGTPLFSNRAAEQMLSAGNGISIRQNRLALSTPSESSRLHKLIADASQGLRGVACGGDLRITLPEQGECLHCLVTPVSAEFSARWNVALPSGCVALFLSRPSGLQLPPKRLASLYGLTPAEARLAAELAASKSLEQAAKNLGVTIQTARSQLKAVFAKTGVRSQPELMVLLATSALAHCRDELN